MLRKALWAGLALSVIGFASIAAGQGTVDKRTVITFNQPVEIAGRVLPAGTYTFMLADPFSDRQMVEIRDAEGTKLIAYVEAIPNYRLRPTGSSVLSFRETPRGSPQAIRAWFYPGDNYGEEFVSPNRRALARITVANAPVPATAAETPTSEETTTAPTAAVSPETKEVPVTPTIQTTPPETTPMESPARTELPKTASNVPLIALLGLGSICVAVGLIAIGRRAKGSAV